MTLFASSRHSAPRVPLRHLVVALRLASECASLSGEALLYRNTNATWAVTRRNLWTFNMIRVFEEFLNKRSAHAFIEKYAADFPASTFGTYLSIRLDRLSRYWVVSGHRFAA